jgi:hypothetical protein
MPGKNRVTSQDSEIQDLRVLALGHPVLPDWQGHDTFWTRQNSISARMRTSGTKVQNDNYTHRPL